MTLKAYLKEIKEFEETKDLKLEPHEIITVYQYVKAKKAFNPDDPNLLYEPILKFDPIRIEYAPSLAFQQAIDKEAKLKNIDTSYHNDYIIDATLEEFSLLDEQRNEAIRYAKEFIEAFEKKRFIKGLYLYGQNRTGKTFLLSAIANALSSKNVTIVFAYVPDLIRNIHSSIGDGSVEEKVKNLKSCELLVLDDLGSAFMSTWFRDQIFGPVIQYRLSVGLPVLISSNLDLQSLTTSFIDPNVANDKYNAVRIVARIAELTTPIPLSLSRYKKN